MLCGLLPFGLQNGSFHLSLTRLISSKTLQGSFSQLPHVGYICLVIWTAQHRWRSLLSAGVRIDYLKDPPGLPKCKSKWCPFLLWKGHYSPLASPLVLRSLRLALGLLADRGQSKGADDAGEACRPSRKPHQSGILVGELLNCKICSDVALSGVTKVPLFYKPHWKSFSFKR